MGAIDLVIQIEAPPSIASGMQRIGRASHQVNTTSSGIVFPKFRGDLIACAAVTDAMHRGAEQWPEIHATILRLGLEQDLLGGSRPKRQGD